MDYAARQLRSAIKSAVNEHLESMPRDYTHRFFQLNTPAPTKNKLINAAKEREQLNRAAVYKNTRRETAAIARQSPKDQRRILRGMHKIHEMTSSGMGGIRGLGHVSGSPAVYQVAGEGDGEDTSYYGKNIADADSRKDQILQLKNAHDKLHAQPKPQSGQMRSGHTTHGFHRDHAAVHQGRHIARVRGKKVNK